MARRGFKLLAVLIPASLAVALAAAPPNFSGAWKVNLAKSDFGPRPAPNSASSKIDHKDPSLKVAGTEVGEQGERTFELNFSTDGAETTNQLGPFTMKSKAHWEGNVLMVESKASTENGELAIKDKWTLSEDGKTLTVIRTLSGPQGEMSMKVVQDKQ
ncbi:MAG: hypothetical protein ABSH05_13915 [Bryobacteraceae bacterium]|jgi:hypothetical protein